MQILSLIWGILAILGMIVGFFPCLGALNWINIPFSGIGIIISCIAMSSAGVKPKGSSIAGLICCIVALLFGLIRLVLGGGVV
jgi:hypothetical protein